MRVHLYDMTEHIDVTIERALGRRVTEGNDTVDKMVR